MLAQCRACALPAGISILPLEHTLAYKLTDRRGEAKKWCVHAGSKVRQPSLDSMPEDILHLIFAAAQLHTAPGEHKLPSFLLSAKPQVLGDPVLQKAGR